MGNEVVFMSGVWNTYEPHVLSCIRDTLKHGHRVICPLPVAGIMV